MFCNHASLFESHVPFPACEKGVQEKLNVYDSSRPRFTQEEDCNFVYKNRSISYIVIPRHIAYMDTPPKKTCCMFNTKIKSDMVQADSNI
jgi:hypothetical protein